MKIKRSKIRRIFFSVYVVPVNCWYCAWFSGSCLISLETGDVVVKAEEKWVFCDLPPSDTVQW